MCCDQEFANKIRIWIDKMFLGGVKLIHLFLVCGFPASQDRWECGWIIGVTWKDCHQATSNNNHATTSVVVSDYPVKINHWHDRPSLDSPTWWTLLKLLTTPEHSRSQTLLTLTQYCLSVQHYKASELKKYSLKSTSSSLSFLGADDQSWSHYSAAGSAGQPS